MFKMNSSKRIFIMGLICIILAYFVWNWTENQINFYLTQISSGSEHIAQIKNIRNEVSRNYSGQLVWQNIDKGEILYIGDSIQTEKNASTEIIFDDGEQILIGPESLVRFTRNQNKISLQLVEGKIEVKAPDAEIQTKMRITSNKPKRLYVATPKGRLEINNSEIKIQAKKNDPENSFKVEVVKGTPVLATSNQKGPLDITKDTGKIEVLKPEEIENLNSKTELPVIKNDLPAAPSTPATENIMAEPPAVADTRSADQTPPVPENNEMAQTKMTEPEQRKPAQVPLKAPKVKSIKIEAFE